MKKISAIIPAAGIGSRFGEAKQFKLLDGIPLLFHSLKIFLSSNIIKEIVLVISEDQIEFIRYNLNSIDSTKPIIVVSGGPRRQDSVKNGLNATFSSASLICIHDAARPFVTENLIEKSIFASRNCDGAVLALPIRDTVKLEENNLVKKTLDRSLIWLTQTPQTFKKDKLTLAFDNAEKNNITGTDESVLMEEMGFPIALVQGNSNNFKITTKNDWERAEHYCIYRSKIKEKID